MLLTVIVISVHTYNCLFPLVAPSIMVITIDLLVLSVTCSFVFFLVLHTHRDDLAFDLQGYTFVLLNNVASAANSELVVRNLQ